ncbi:hypothetical protein UPYG_G00095840 [Umbra pygmaea]|uniref:CxC7-like cysteine cluster associated with KDZ transposases domain-containing protein n=1 Tax=Umbra pygmaea TaxID=75934 RepID=A0ABD0WZT7_UMBPY
MITKVAQSQNDLANKDFVLIPIWKPGHYMLCCISDFQGLPRQKGGNACGIFMLMDDMATIRTWWCLLLLSGHSVVRLAQKRKSEDPIIIADEEAKRPRTIPPEQSETVDLTKEMGILEITRCCLKDILLEVVLQDGDEALMTLALVCSSFRDIVSDENFRERAHFLWLDSVTNWSRFSTKYKKEFRTMYSVLNCSQCYCPYKSCMPGYVGRGRRGELRGIYSEDPHPGFCSHFCQSMAGFPDEG